MSTGYQDFQYMAGVNILSVSEGVEFTVKEVIGTVDINIESVAETVVFTVDVQGTVDVNIKSQETNITITGTVDINAIASVVKIEPSEEAVFEIKPQAGVVFNISGSVNANITNSTLSVVVQSGSVDVNVTNSSIDVNITNTSINVDVQNEVDVNIKNASIDVNVKNSVLNVSVSGQASVSIDNASVYLDVQNQNIKMIATGHTSNSPTQYAAIYATTTYFTLFRNAMGLIYRLGIWIRNNTTSDIDITFRLKNSYDAAPLIERTVTVPAGHDDFVYAVTLSTDAPRIWWQYDTLILEYQPSTDGLEIGRGDWSNLAIGSSGPTGHYSVAVDFYILLQGGGSIPVSGTVNTINIPNRTTKVSFSGTVTSAGWFEAINESFIGTIKRIILMGSSGANLSGSMVRITIDNDIIIEDELINLALHRIAKIMYSTLSGFYVVIETEMPGLVEPDTSVIVYYESLG